MRFVDIERAEDGVRYQTKLTKGMQPAKVKIHDTYAEARRYAIKNMGATGCIVEARDIHGVLV